MKNIKIAILATLAIGLWSFTYPQLFQTSLKIKVLNELGNIEEGVSVQLYATEEDYRAETNPVSDVQVTNKKGEVRFKELEPKVYFVNAVKGDKNNVGAGVQTDTLEDGKMNKITLIIE